MKDRFATAVIIKIGAQGDGLATHNDRPVYVAKTAPGDMANFALGKPRAEGYAATLQKIITPSPYRAEPPCPYFSRCGACSLQHVNNEFYRNWKITKVEQALARANVKVQQFETPIFLPASTRRRTTLTALRTKSGAIIGYNEARSHNIVDINACLVLEPELDQKIQKMRAFLPHILPEGKACDITLQLTDGALDVIFTGPLQHKGRFSLEQDEAFGELMEALSIARLSWRLKDFAKTEIILSRAPVTKKFGGLRVQLPPAAFLQASDAGEQALTTIVLNHAKGAAKVADLFSGCGTFTGHLLGTGAQVTAIDGDGAAIAALQATKHANLTASRRDLFKVPFTEQELSAFDTVVFDPPRAGAKEQAERLAWSSVQRIIGVSCNPATFGRDAAILQEGGYKLQSVTIIDQFVYAAHVEVAGLFVKG